MRKTIHHLQLISTGLGLLWMWLLACSCGLLVTPFAGNFSKLPQNLATQISPEAQEVVNRAFEGLPPNAHIIEAHVQLIGLGSDGSGTWLNPLLNSFWFPLEALKTQSFFSAAGVQHTRHADREYLERLIDLAKYFGHPIKIFLTAFDKTYAHDGRLLEEYSTFFVPNEYVVEISHQYPELFLPVISIHPYRKNALAELEQWGKSGIKYLKLAPKQMGINLADEQILPYYAIMKKYQMVLIVQIGDEQELTITNRFFQIYDNPLFLKTPLELQIPVIVSHLANFSHCRDFQTLGKGPNFEESELLSSSKIPCLDLFWRLFNNPRYEKLLYADIAGATFYDYLGPPLTTILENPQLQDRIINSSGYPLPAFNSLIRTSELTEREFISAQERATLNEIYDFNPLLFDFVVKRILKHPQTKHSLLSTVFVGPRSLPGLH